MQSLWIYFGCCLTLAVVPGPDNAFVLAESVAVGAGAGVLVTLGLCTGLCFHTSLVALGAAEFLKRHPKALTGVTLLGALYLLSIAVRTWLAAAPAATGAAGADLALTGGALYGRGVIMNVCNPKVLIFFLAFLPKFSNPQRGHLFRQFLLLGALFALAAFIVFSLIALAGGSIAHSLAATPNAQFYLQRGSAVVLALIALWFAFSGLHPVPPNS